MIHKAGAEKVLAGERQPSAGLMRVTLIAVILTHSRSRCWQKQPRDQRRKMNLRLWRRAAGQGVEVLAGGLPGSLPGLVCPHADKVQSNGVLRMTDFEGMMLRHPGERGITIDHFAALVIDGDQYRVISLEGKPGSVLDTETFSPTREGKPGCWTKDVVEGKVKTALVPTEGSLASLVRKATEMTDDPGLAVVRSSNPAV